jgi:phosphatidate cytidylyltransferase
VPDDREREEGEELFEDLDKFFAPIQDVDWPEPSAPQRHEPEPEPGGGGAEPSGESSQLAPETAAAAPSFDATAGGDEPPSDRAPTPEPSAPPAPFGGAPSEEELEEREELEGEEEDELEGEEAEEEPAGVGSFLFEQEAEEYDVLDEEEQEGPGEDEGAAELEEPEPEEEAPDLEAVEAAAEHFASSVRDEVAQEVGLPEAPDVSARTEEIAVAELLGDEAAEPEGARTVRVGPEGLGGPSWQEPTAVEVGAEPERRGPRELPTRFLTGLILAGLAIGAVFLGEGPFAIFAGLVVLFAQGELYLALQKRHYQPATALGLVAGALILGAGYYRGEGAMLAVTALATFASFLWYMTVPAPHRRNVASNVALTVLGIAYIPLLAAYALAVLKLPDGQELAVSIIGLTFAYDTAALIVGSWWGSRPLSPNVSPKKSIEGAVGATFVTVIVAIGLVSPNVTLLDTIGRSVGLAVVVAIFAPLGDLAESLLKRDLGMKDMGGILPGHGGVLDRIDSVLFVAPAAFIYLRLILL